MFQVTWDGQEYGSGYPGFAVYDRTGMPELPDSEGRAAGYSRSFESREAAEARAAAKNARSRRALMEYLSS